MAKVNLDILLAGKDEEATAWERAVALVGEGLPALLSETAPGDFMLGCPIGFMGVSGRAAALKSLGRVAETIAWMREYAPRFEAVSVSRNASRSVGNVSASSTNI